MSNDKSTTRTGLHTSIRHLVPEAQLLFNILAGPPRASAVGDLLDAGIDWNYFIWLVAKERASPVASKWLGSVPSGTVPEEARSRLVNHAMVTRFRMMRLRDRLGETLGALQGSGIEVILLKGAALASTVYTSFEERPMSDLDLLVREEDGATAWEIVRRTGWRPTVPDTGSALYDEHQHYPPLIDEGGTSLGLDLHTGLLSADHPFELRITELWSRAKPLPSWGPGVYILDNSAQLLHLSLHFAWSHHLRASAWRSCRDIGRLMGNGLIEWSEFVEVAESARASSCVYWTLRLARNLAGLPVPGEVLSRLRPPGSEYLLRLLERHYLSQLVKGPGLGCPSPRLSRLGWSLGVRPGWSGHGAARPWARVAEFQTAREAALTGGDDVAGPSINGSGKRGRRGSRLGQLPIWARYLGTVAGLATPQSRRDR